MAAVRLAERTPFHFRPAMAMLTETNTALLGYLGLVGWFFVQTDGFVQTDILRYCTLKSAPIFLLALLAHLGIPNFTSKCRIRLALGLFFSGVGDFLLSTNEFGFHAGSISFAVSHIFYIAYFGPVLREFSAGITGACLGYAFFVNHFFIIPHLSHQPIAMLILISYSFVICAAVVVAGSLYMNGSISGHKGREYRNLMIGYGLFFLSDTCVLLVHLGFKFPMSGVIILLSYYAAQYLIFENAVRTQIPAGGR